jgi:MoxR-like ATPase
LDRFFIRLSIGYPTPEEEDEILRQRSERGKDSVDLQAVISPETFLAMRASVEEVYVDPDVRRYIVDLVAKTRQHRQVVVGASPRASIALLKLAKAWAAIQGRSYVVPDDIKLFLQPVLAHRIVLDPTLWDVKTSDRAVIEEVIRLVPVPVLPQ